MNDPKFTSELARFDTLMATARQLAAELDAEHARRAALDDLAMSAGYDNAIEKLVAEVGCLG
jgi:hypothetical protein